LKILILTPRIPFPLRDGGAIAMNQTLEGYIEQGCEVSMLAMNTARHWVEETELPSLYKNLVHFNTVYINNSINPFSAFINLFTDKSYNVERFINKKYEQALIDMLKLEEFDIVQFESIYTSPYLKTVQTHSQAKTYCRVHNIEYQIWQRLSEHEPSFFKRKYLTLLTNRLKNFELDVLKKFDLLLPISTNEETFLNKEKINSCYYLPFGVNDNTILPDVACELNSCYHIGSMDWSPNIEGVEWFLENVWQEACKQLPNVTFYIAGKNMSATFLAKKDEHTAIIGEVDDFISFSLEKNIMIVPLQSGAGIRIKILEAMELGKTIISTSIGAEGIGAVNNEHIIIADTARDFIDALIRCFNEPEVALRIGKNARKYVSSHFHKNQIYKEAITMYKNLM
jgi:glycosyltransferase involved in cell wall biosynthesis